MFLATTSLSSFWDPQEEMLFLGPWCGGPRAQTLPSPWDDRERFHAAAGYLDRRMEQTLQPLIECLNAQLGRSGSLRYWRILIGTWLMHSLHVAYDRYVHLTEAFKRHPNLRTLLLDPTSFQIPSDTAQAVNGMMSDDAFNLQLFSQLMIGMGYSFPAKPLSLLKKSNRKNASGGGLQQTLRGISRGAQSLLSRCLEKRADAKLIEMYCPPSTLWALCLESGFKAVPLLLPEKEGEPIASPLPDRRRSALAELPAADEFMQIWVRTLPENFPTLYLEGFPAARERALRRVRRQSSRMLVSATGWHYSEPFKFFAAEHSQRGGRLVAVQHGSGYGLFRSMPMEQHERRVSDSFLDWKDAPALQRMVMPKRGRAARNLMLFVATTNPRYPFRFYSAPQAHQLEEYFEWQVRFLESIGADLRREMEIRLHPVDFGHRLRQRLQQRLPDLRWDKRRGFPRSASMSRLLVVDHPGTSMLIALAGNFPTLLFWDPRLWEFRSEAQPHLESLRQVGLLHEDPQAAARAVQEILREGPERWWNQALVQTARQRFTERYAPMPDDRLRLWSERLQGLKIDPRTEVKEPLTLRQAQGER